MIVIVKSDCDYDGEKSYINMRPTSAAVTSIRALCGFEEKPCSAALAVKDTLKQLRKNNKVPKIKISALKKTL